MDYNYLKVGNGADSIEFTGSLSPSQIIPGIELIKNIERALNGKLHVDITASKQKLQIIFDILGQEEFEQVLDIFKAENTDEIDPEGLSVEYFDLRNSGVKTERKFFVESVSFMPYIVENDVKWRDIVVDLLEI